MKQYTQKEKKLVENKLIRELKKRGVFNCKGNPEQLKGFPDRMIFINNHIIFVEFKAGKKLGSYYKQTPLQKKWQEQIEKSGSYYKLVIGQEGVDAFLAWFDIMVEFFGKFNCF